jgi:hypothetical protein
MNGSAFHKGKAEHRETSHRLEDKRRKSQKPECEGKGARPSLRQSQGALVIDHSEAPPTPILLGGIHVSWKARGTLLANDANALRECVNL